MASKPQTHKPVTTSSDEDKDYVVHVTNASTGAEEDLHLPFSARIRRLYSLWPTFTPYIIGFTLLGLSFIAHTLHLFALFSILLALSAIVVIGTALYRLVRSK